MFLFQKFSFLILLVTSLSVYAQKKVQLKSPDGNIIFSLTLSPEAPVYTVSFKGKKIVADSELGLNFKETGRFGGALSISKSTIKHVDESYDLVIGKTKTVRNRYQEAIISLTESKGIQRRINLAVRVFNDGLAFRYEFPEQRSWSSYILTDESSTFNVTGNPLVHALLRDNYNTSHEGFYQQQRLDDITPDTLMDMPALLEFPDHVYMAITEANLRDYAGMYLIKHNGVLKSQLSPHQGQTEIKVKAVLPHRSPWRVMMISDRMETLMESNILVNLNDPVKIKDLSWLKPGKTSFHWWNGDVTPDTTFAPGINFETNKYYIDFCARNHIEYHSVIGYGGFAWYKSDATGYATVGPNTDVTKTVPSLDMQRVCDYAREKGVGIHVWVNWKAIYPKLEESFAQFEKWGIKGMMVDFLDRDDQEMVNIQEEILKKAAEHKLFIQFHGAFKPTGLHRTYPNEFTREGALNYEVNKWSKEGLSPDHDIDIPFTRLLAGATDYHLGGFRAVPPSRFKAQYTRPLMIGTRCHMLAMYVVLESYLAMVADYPKAYEGQPGFDFLQKVPVSWDETRVLKAEIGQYVTTARRKGNDWYLGTINNTTSRTLEIPLDFLPEGNYTAEIYTDAPDTASNPNALTKETKIVDRSHTITVRLAPGGGQVMRLMKQ
ncbi:glycoside hydrolase family 97 protein [Chitinophaga sp. XS-30]|uniref:glycoside hydrolase family 97 protein n=1 Tax=Chitinophaga sp. XS-30 TaxID=2604421 RepID=UPI0011DD4585|nr:glycoside hydrolase family 97 protein [Chitinophaga sp. XS-30]QEH41227.1 glycoside hydrolase family 97 protein [Chitinophaga sp. XS-30]